MAQKKNKKVEEIFPVYHGEDDSFYEMEEKAFWRTHKKNLKNQKLLDKILENNRNLEDIFSND